MIFSQTCEIFLVVKKLFRIFCFSLFFLHYSLFSVEITLKEIISLTGGKCVQGHDECFVRGIASLDKATDMDISFLGNEKYYADYLATKAGMILVPSQVEQYPENAAIIEVENPSFAFDAVVKAVSSKQRNFKPGIHPKAIIADGVKLNPEKVCVKAGAVVEEGCEIGDGTEIGANAVISENVKVGADCLIYPNVTVREFCELGDRVILQPNCVIGSDGYGYEMVDGEHKKVDQVGIVVLEDDVEVGSNTTIDRARFGKTVIGKGSKVDNLVQIAHNAEIGEHCLLVSQSGIAGSSKLGNYVTVAAQAGVAGHLEIGDKAILMARAGVAKDLKGGQVYMGFPARPVKEEQRKLASLARLPKLVEQVKDLSKELKNG